MSSHRASTATQLSTPSTQASRICSSPQRGLPAVKMSQVQPQTTFQYTSKVLETPYPVSPTQLTLELRQVLTWKLAHRQRPVRPPEKLSRDSNPQLDSDTIRCTGTSSASSGTPGSPTMLLELAPPSPGQVFSMCSKRCIPPVSAREVSRSGIA